jgi:hypothetical protein
VEKDQVDILRARGSRSSNELELGEVLNTILYVVVTGCHEIVAKIGIGDEVFSIIEHNAAIGTRKKELDCVWKSPDISNTEH